MASLRHNRAVSRAKAARSGPHEIGNSPGAPRVLCHKSQYDGVVDRGRGMPFGRDHEKIAGVPCHSSSTAVRRTRLCNTCKVASPGLSCSSRRHPGSKREQVLPQRVPVATVDRAGATAAGCCSGCGQLLGSQCVREADFIAAPRDRARRPAAVSCRGGGGRPASTNGRAARYRRGRREVARLFRPLGCWRSSESAAGGHQELPGDGQLGHGT